jgi:large subunit ribosomal protein L9
MKVVLTKNLDNLGIVGETVNVSDGYARNYLIPSGLVLQATPKVEKRYAQVRAAEEIRQQKEREVLKELAGKLSETEIIIKMKAGEGGKLYGSVTSEDIVEGIKQTHGIEIDKKKISHDDIKTVGTHTVRVHFAADIEATLKVKVEAEVSNQYLVGGGVD